MSNEISHSRKDSLIQSNHVIEELEVAGKDWLDVAIGKFEILSSMANSIEVGVYPSKNPEISVFMDSFVGFLYSRQKEAGSEIDYEVIDDAARTASALDDQSGFLTEFGVSLAKADKNGAVRQLLHRNGPLNEVQRKSVLLAIAEKFVYSTMDLYMLEDMIQAYRDANPDK